MSRIFVSRFLAARISYVPDVVCSSLFCHICVYIASSILALVGWSQDDPEEKRATVLNFVRYGAKFRYKEQRCLTFVFEWIFPLLACIAHESEIPIPEVTSGHSNVRISTSSHVTS